MPADPVARIRRLLGDSIAASPIATVVTDPALPDNPIVLLNAAFEALTQYGASEVVGRNCRFLGEGVADPRQRDALRTAIAQGRPCLVELVNRRKDGSTFLNAVMVAPVRDEGGRIAFFLGSQMDVGAEGLARALRTQAARRTLSTLTPRQRQVLDGMQHGLLNKQIAATLGIDEKTVKMHRAALLHRMGARNTAEALRIALEAV